MNFCLCCRLNVNMKICHKYENLQINGYFMLVDLLALWISAQEVESKLIFFKIFYRLIEYVQISREMKE